MKVLIISFYIIFLSTHSLFCQTGKVVDPDELLNEIKIILNSDDVQNLSNLYYKHNSSSYGIGITRGPYETTSEFNKRKYKLESKNKEIAAEKRWNEILDTSYNIEKKYFTVYLPVDLSYNPDKEMLSGTTIEIFGNIFLSDNIKKNDYKKIYSHQSRWTGKYEYIIIDYNPFSFRWDLHMRKHIAKKLNILNSKSDKLKVVFCVYYYLPKPKYRDRIPEKSDYQIRVSIEDFEWKVNRQSIFSMTKYGYARVNFK